jgi:hypothetical protein
MLAPNINTIMGCKESFWPKFIWIRPNMWVSMDFCKINKESRAR